MFKGMSTFQLVFTGLFGGFLVIGVILFATYKGSSGSKTVKEPIVIWGSMNKGQFDLLLSKTNMSSDPVNPVTYLQKSPATFDSDLLEAIAEGTPPDLVLLTQEQIYKEKKRLFPIPYANLDERTFKDTYAQEAELFLAPEGILAIPFMIDPYVMYWNRDIFQNNAIGQPPQYWDQFYGLTSTFTKKDGALNITQATIGLGEYKNVTHAKEVLSTLIMQAGNPITIFSEGRLKSVLAETLDNPSSPAEAAVNYYTEFSNPVKDSYTWNRSLPETKNMFISGDLAMYFGPASELFEIQDKNPNLNFDVTYLPQSRVAKNKVTFGMLSGFAIVKSSSHIAAAFKVANMLAGEGSLSILNAITGLPPVRRSMLAAKQTNAYSTVFNNSALVAKGWLEPNDAESDKIFQELIESITAGRQRPSQAIGYANISLVKSINDAVTPVQTPAIPGQ